MLIFWMLFQQRFRNFRPQLSPQQPSQVAMRYITSLLMLMLFALGSAQVDVSQSQVNPDDATLANTLVVAIPQDIQTFDPFAVNEVAGESLVRALFDNLLERDLEGNLVPGLATSYEIIDPTTIEFVLRQGVTFHNGEVFDARSVVFSVEQLLNPDANYANAGQFSAIDRVEVIDDYTMRLHLNRTDASIFDKLTAQLVMVPADYYAEVGTQGFAARPIGTGPFQFVQHTRDVDALLAANPNYWQGSYKRTPLVPFVRFRVIPEAATALAEFQAGNVDIVSNLPADFTPLVSRSGGQIISRDVPTLNMIWFNAFGGEVEVLQDSRIRQALNYAVDVETILTTLQGGYGVRLASTLTPLSLGFEDDLEPYPYDPEQARALLEEANFPFDTELSLSVPPNVNRTIAEAVISYLEDVGLNVRLQFLDLAAFNDAWVRDSEPAMGALFIASWGGLFDPGSQSFFLASDARASYYSNAQVDELLTAAEAELDPDVRTAYYQQIAQLTHEDPVGIYLWAPASLYGVSSRVAGWQAHPRDFVLVSGSQLITANSQR